MKRYGDIVRRDTSTNIPRTVYHACEFIYLICTEHGLYVGKSSYPLDRAKYHQYDRYSGGLAGEMHDDMRDGGYVVYILDLRLGECGTKLESIWIHYINIVAASVGLKCWNKNQTNVVADFDYCHSRYDNAVEIYSWEP